jgi:hypothetical protein
MIRITPRRSRGRPFGPPPVFVADCQRFDATTLLAKSRGARFSVEDPGASELLGQWVLRWAEDGRPLNRTVAIRVTTTRQHLGGSRFWWRCPVCRRRCRVLLAVNPEAPLGCRLCLNARYASDYPARDRRRQFVSLIHGLGQGSLDVDADRELDALLARRRRGVRRGRRVCQRAIRALIRVQARAGLVTAIVQRGGL